MGKKQPPERDYKAEMAECIAHLNALDSQMDALRNKRWQIHEEYRSYLASQAGVVETGDIVYVTEAHSEGGDLAQTGDLARVSYVGDNITVDGDLILVARIDFLMGIRNMLIPVEKLKRIKGRRIKELVIQLEATKRAIREEVRDKLAESYILL